jgi:hypothetical protein
MVVLAEGRCLSADVVNAQNTTRDAAICDECLVAGGLSDGITALQRLARLRLQNVLTAPLTDAVSALSTLTSMYLLSSCGVPDDQLDLPLLPAAATALSSLQRLDISETFMPPAVEALTGMQTVHGQPRLGAHLELSII